MTNNHQDAGKAIFHLGIGIASLGCFFCMLPIMIIGGLLIIGLLIAACDSTISHQAEPLMSQQVQQESPSIYHVTPNVKEQRDED